MPMPTAGTFVGSNLSAHSPNYPKGYHWFTVYFHASLSDADKFTVAKKTLVESGWEAAEEKVLVLTLADKPGSLAFIASKLADLGINIRHACAGAADTRREIRMYLGVSDLTQAQKGLR